MQIKKHIPNAITCCNLICGCIAIGYALHEHYATALLMIVMGAVFDFFDGMTARLLHVSSNIGKELDSLADVVTFGVAPATMVFAVCSCKYVHYPESLGMLSYFIPYLAYLLAAFSALRLAKFNLDTRQSTSFIGLPTPANALFWGSLIVSYQRVFYSPNANYWGLILLVGVCIFSYLLVCELPMFALKFKNLSWADNKIKYIFVITSLILLVTMGISGIAATIVWYLLLSAVYAQVNK